MWLEHLYLNTEPMWMHVTFKMIHASDISAALGDQSDTIRMLLEEFGCDSNIRGYSGRTLVHQACSKGHLHVVNMLVKEFSLTVNSEDEKKKTPLHWACELWTQ